MSGSLHSADKGWLNSMLKQGKLTEAEVKILLEAFDKQTDFDIAAAEGEVKQTKFYKKVCLYKLVLFPLEETLVLLLLGVKAAKRHAQVTKLYYDFYKGRINLAEFAKKLPT